MFCLGSKYIWWLASFLKLLPDTCYSNSKQPRNSLRDKVSLEAPGSPNVMLSKFLIHSGVIQVTWLVPSLVSPQLLVQHCLQSSPLKSEMSGCLERSYWRLGHHFPPETPWQLSVGHSHYNFWGSCFKNW